jgi:hypothetical protein
MNTALYTYAVMAAGTPPPAVAAILPGADILTVAEGDIAVLASPVPRAWFEAGPECRTDDPAWLAECAAAHHTVVVGLGGPVLPLAFGAMFSAEAPLRAWLRERAALFTQALSAVRGRSEWSLLLSEDSCQHLAWLRAQDAELAMLASRAEAAGPGTEFMLTRRLERALEAARQARRRAATSALGQLLEGICARVSHSTAPGPDGVVAFNLLVGDDDLAGLREALEAEELGLQSSGLALRLSGPWPPYAFAREATAHG